MNYSYFTNEYTLTKEMCAETEHSGVNTIYPFASISITAAAILMIKSFPQLVGDKRYDEQLKFLPSFGIILRLSIPELMILARFIRQ